MAEEPQDPHPDEIYSDLNVLIEMAADAKHDEQAVLRALESLKTKLDRYVHKSRTQSRGGPAT
jgi:hypothetical protein